MIDLMAVTQRDRDYMRRLGEFKARAHAQAELIGRVGMPWALLDGHAVNAWVEPRLTRDIDVTVAADASAQERLKKAFADTGWRIVKEQGGHPQAR